MNDQPTWISVYKSNNEFEAQALLGNLENEGLTPVLINKIDRSYLAFGYAEIQVPEEQVTMALDIIKRTQL